MGNEVIAADREEPLSFSDWKRWILFQTGGRALAHPRFCYYLFEREQRYEAQNANNLFWADFNKKNLSYEEFHRNALDPRHANRTIARFHRFMQEFKGRTLRWPIIVELPTTHFLENDPRREGINNHILFVASLS